MLLKKGLKPKDEKIDYWDRWHRRENTESRHLLRKGQDIWWNAPTCVKSLHNQHAVNTLALSNPIVILAVGTPAQKWMNVFSGAQVHAVMIDGIRTQVHAVMIDGIRTQIHIKGGQVERLVVGCPHPETMFFPQAILYGKLMDSAINFAVGLAELSVDLSMNYFAEKGAEMEQRRRMKSSLAILPYRESRVVTVARLRRFEIDNGVNLDATQIPEHIIWVHARSIGVENSVAGLQSTLKPGQTLCAAILQRYAEKSHLVMKAKNWPNLKKATKSQEDKNWQSLRKAASNRMAAAQALRTGGGETTTRPSIHVCQECQATYKSRQGLWEHKRKDHEGHRFVCPYEACGKSLKSRSGMSKHVQKQHHSKEI